MPEDILVDINAPLEDQHDFTQPVTLETEVIREFNIPEIKSAIMSASDSNDDDKRRLTTLHIASLTNQNPNDMNYDAAVASYFGEYAKGAPVAQTFERLQGKLSPEIDDNYTSLQEFTGLPEEEQLKKSVEVIRTPSDSGMVVGSMFGYYDPSRAKTQTKEEEQASTIAGMTPEQKRASIAKYQRDLLNKSPRAIIEHGEKVLSDKARRMADKMSFGHDVGMAAFKSLSKTDQAHLHQYVRAINPAVDSSSWDYLFTRGEQTAGDIGESLVKTGQRMASNPDDPTRVYEKFSTNMNRSAVDYFADNGKWATEEDEQKARQLAIGIMESTPAYRMYKQMERNWAATGRGLSFSERADQRESMIQSTMGKLQNKIYEGREHVNQRKFDKAIKGATRKLFKAGIAEKVIVEGTVVMADMAVALAAGIPTAGTGTVAYSYGRVFGDFTETLIDDHNVDPDEAVVIGGLGAVVYSAIERLQVGQVVKPFMKGATKTQTAFMKSFKDGLPKFVKKIADSKNPIMVGLLETAKTMTVETAEESAQAFTEQVMKAYAKEYADAEGVEYSDLVGDWWDQTKDAVTGMALISMGRGARRAQKQFTGNFDNLTGKENILAEPGGLDLDVAAKSFDELSPEIQEDLHEAVSVNDIALILEENNIDMTAQDYLRVQDIGAAVESDVEVQREELEKGITEKSQATDIDYIDVNRDIERTSQKADAKQFVAPMSEHVDLTETAPGKFTIKSKTNENSIDLEFAPIGSGEAGKYQGGKITLPENAKDFTFTHEIFHGMFDIGVITQDEQSTLVESAVRRIDTDTIDQRYKEKYASLVDGGDFTEAIRDEEFMAHLVETAAKDPNFTKDFTPEERTIWQKVVEFIQSLYSKKIRATAKALKGEDAKGIQSNREEAKANLILKDILSGKMLTRDVPGQKAEVDIDAFYESEYGADIDAEVKRMQNLIEPDAAAAERMQEDIDRDEALLETALKVPPIPNEVKIILDGRKFRFDEKMEEEVEKLSPAEKARLTKYRATDKDAQTSDVVFDELVAARVLGENATVTEMIEQLARPAAARFALRNTDSLTNKWKKKGVDLFIIDKKDEIKLNHISVDKDKRGSGIGSQVMENLIDLADRKNKVVRLTPATQDKNFGTTSRKRLIKFYKRFGFVENKGRNKDFSYNHDEMYRVPAVTKFSIAPATDTPEFKKWFGDSKVVNEDGSPKVVYHGTPEGGFNEFSKEKKGKRTKHKPEDVGFHFTNDTEYASSYSLEYKKKHYDAIIDALGYLPEHQKAPEDAMTYKVFLSLQNPLIISDAKINKSLIQRAKDNGNDGIIGSLGKSIKEYVVFDPTQIKSATENVGTFDPTNPDIRYAIKQDPNTDLAAMALAGHQFEKGKQLNEAQINKALDAYGVTDETARIETVRRADMILNEMAESKADLKNHKEITQALVAANLNVEYREGLDRIEKESFKGGKTYQKAVDTLKAREKAARLADTQDLDDDTIAYLVSQYHENITKEESDIDIARLLPSIEQAIRENMIKNELITAKNQKGYKSMPEYRGTLAKTLEAISLNLVRQITPGRRKTALYADARKLKTLTTAKSIENNFNKLIAKIHESRIVEDKATLLKRFNKIFKSAAVKAQEKSTQELIHSKVKKDEDGNIIAKDIEPMVKRELNLIKQIAKISQVEADKIRDDMFKFYNDPSDLEGQDADALFKDLEERFPAFKKYKHLEPVDRAAIMAKVSAQYGGIKEKTTIELNDAIDSIVDMIEGSQKNIEDVINKKNEIAQPRRDAVTGLKGKRRGELGQKFDRFLASSFGMRSFFQDILRQAPSDKGKEAKKHLDEMLGNWNDSIHTRDVAIMHDHESFGLAIQDIYNSTDAWATEKDLNTKKKEFAHFSKHGDKMSKFQVMQLYASAVQQDYLKNAESHNRKSSEYAKVLTHQDMKMIQWFRDYYSNERTSLSKQMEKMTGIPIEMLDPFYVPVKIESNQAGLGTEINATAIIPPGMIKRVNHTLDFDDSVGMFEIWARKVEENNHFKYTADAAVEMRSVFSSKPVHEALEYNSGRSYKNAFLTMIKDNINNGGPSTYDLKAIDTIRGAWTASKFALNARIGIKQITSIPAFGLEIGLVDTAKHVKSFWSPEGWEAVKEIWNSDLRKERWGAGNTEAINNAIGGMGSHTTLSKWVKRSMIFNNLGDMAPTLMVGQGIYRSYTETYYSQGPQTEAALKEAKARALSKTFQIVESTQQSGKLKDMAEWQRRGGSLGKMAAQFTNTTRQFLERDFTDVRAYLADRGDLEKKKRAASTVFINHVLLPGAYNGMNMLINLAMGDDIDEEDWWLMFSSMISGPMSGFIVFGSMITGAIETGVTGRTPWGNKSLTPFAGIKDDVNNVVLATEGILTADWDQFDKAFTKLMKSLFAPYREVTKYNKNN